MQGRPFIAEFPGNWSLDAEKRPRSLPHFLSPTNPSDCNFFNTTQSCPGITTAISYRICRRWWNWRVQGAHPCPVRFPDGSYDYSHSCLYSGGQGPQEGEDHSPEDVPPPHELTVNDLFIKDAFLVFRALCKLTMKPVTTERCAYSHPDEQDFNDFI